MIYKGSRTIQWRKEVFSKIGAEAIRYTHAKKWIWTPILQHIQSESHPVVSDSLRPHGLYSPRNSPGQNTGVGSCSLLQRIFPTQGSNPGLAHCRWILYQLSYKGSPIRSGYPRPSPEDLSDPGIKPRSPALHLRSLPTELSGKPHNIYKD